MAFCSKCGAQVGEGDLFCSKCGEKVVAAEVSPPPVSDVESKMALCSKCGTQVGEGDLFCSKCGTEVAAPEVSPPPVSDIERKGQQIAEAGRHEMIALIAGAVGVVLLVAGLALGLMTRTHVHQGLFWADGWLGTHIHQFRATVYEHHPYRNLSLGLGAGGALVALTGFGKGLYCSIKSRRLLKELEKQKEGSAT